MTINQVVVSDIFISFYVDLYGMFELMVSPNRFNIPYNINDMLVNNNVVVGDTTT